MGGLLLTHLAHKGGKMGSDHFALGSTIAFAAGRTDGTVDLEGLEALVDGADGLDATQRQAPATDGLQATAGLMHRPPFEGARGTLDQGVPRGCNVLPQGGHGSLIF